MNAAADVVLFARQPLFTSAGDVHGYELLFRRPDGSAWPPADETRATAHVIVSALTDVGLPAVTGGRRAWLNVPAELLKEADLDVLPKPHVVIELRTPRRVDEELVARVQQLSREGFQIALDAFQWRDGNAPLVEAATYVKLDMRALGIDGVAEQCRALEGKDVRIVAVKVETPAEREACLNLGIELFQGYFFERPRLLRGRPARHRDIGGLSSVAALGAAATFEDLEAILRTDPGLSYRLLRYVNSAAVGLRNEVSSLRQTLMLVGVNTVRQWLLLVQMSEVDTGRPELMRSGLVRARICELLALTHRCRPETAFVAGMLSICDALFDRPMAEVVADLPLSEELRDALVKREGRLGGLIDTAIAVQHGDDGGSFAAAHAAPAAIAWADEHLSSLVAAGTEAAAA